MNILMLIVFIQVGEAIPLDDASMDAVVGTLVLCSVKDVNLTLQGTCSGLSSDSQHIQVFQGL